MAEETQYTPNTGMVTVNTAGSVSAAILTGARNGTLIKSVIIKAQTNTTHGKISLYISDGTNNRLFKEVAVPAVTKSGVTPAFQVIMPINFKLVSGWSLKASTANAETFNVIAEGQDWAYYATSVRLDTTKYAAYNSAVTISTANTALDGTGTLGKILTSAGTNLKSIIVKGKGASTSEGMIRVFLFDGVSTTKLIWEIPVIPVTQSGTYPTFSRKLVFDNFFTIKSGWEVKVSTEKAEAFNVISESLDWSYPA